MNHTAKLRWQYVAIDLLTTFIGFVGFNVLRYFILDSHRVGYDNLMEYLLSFKIVAEEIAVPIMALGFYWLSGYYNKPLYRSRIQEFFTTAITLLIFSLLLFFGFLSNDMQLSLGRNFSIFLLLFAVLFLFVYPGRLMVTTRMLKRFAKGKWRYRVLIAGTGDKARAVYSQLSHSKALRGYDVAGFVDMSNGYDHYYLRNNVPVYKLDELERACDELNISEIIMAPQSDDQEEVLRQLNLLIAATGVRHSSLPIKIKPGQLQYLTSGIHLKDIFGEPFVDLTTANTDEATKNIKRVIDVTLSSLALLVLSPLMAGIAVAIKSEDRKNVFYSQERVGRHRRPFNLYKFRTMRTDAEKNGPSLSTEDDPRVTKVGKVLRKYRLDELPQFWNVLKGEMSLVGPRPERQYFVDKILPLAPWYVLVHQVRPGITSWGMVKFGYASDVKSMVERSGYDLIYLSNMSLIVDFKIMIYTVRTIFRGEGK